MIDINKLDFDKLNGLLPAVIQDNTTQNVLMIGFMNKEALSITIETKKVTFFSRTRNKLWTKGETSGNYLNLISISSDCDNDSLLIKVNPIGNVCHNDTYSCFNENKNNVYEFLPYLFEFIKERKNTMPANSYTSKLFNSGLDRIIQKVGEEAIETVIAAKNKDKDNLLNEVSDLVYHLFVLFVELGIDFKDVNELLKNRHK